VLLKEKKSGGNQAGEELLSGNQNGSGQGRAKQAVSSFQFQ
jgi:hypothetical protein